MIRHVTPPENERMSPKIEHFKRKGLSSKHFFQGEPILEAIIPNKSQP